MNNQIIVEIIIGIGAIAWALMFYLIKNIYKKHDVLDKTTNKQALQLQKLEDKIWDSGKLERMISVTFRNVINEWELRMIREGLLHKHEDEK